MNSGQREGGPSAKSCGLSLKTKKKTPAFQRWFFWNAFPSGALALVLILNDRVGFEGSNEYSVTAFLNLLRTSRLVSTSQWFVASLGGRFSAVRSMRKNDKKQHGMYPRDGRLRCLHTVAASAEMHEAATEVFCVSLFACWKFALSRIERCSLVPIAGSRHPTGSNNMYR